MRELFGYIKTQKSELRMREYEYYRASYCGLCRAMGKCTGQCSRLSLSYDFAFLANVRMALLNTTPHFSKRRCLAHPFTKRLMMEPNGELCYTADASALLAFEKCRDDLADERGFRRIRAFFRCLLLSRAYRKAKRRRGALAQRIREHLAALSQLEKMQRASVDEPAAVFGELLADICAEELEGEAEAIARQIGRLVGRFIYIADAADDLENDLKKHRFNPFALLYGRALTDEEKQGVSDALTASLCDLEAAFDLISDAGAERRAVLQNILYLGMPATVRHVLYGEARCHKEEQK